MDRFRWNDLPDWPDRAIGADRRRLRSASVSPALSRVSPRNGRRAPTRVAHAFSRWTSRAGSMPIPASRISRRFVHTPPRPSSRLNPGSSPRTGRITAAR
jgi:hypothetical protein